MKVAAFEDICCYPLLIPYPVPDFSCHATWEDAWDDKTFLVTSDLRFRDEFSPRTQFGLSHTIFISSSYIILIITLFKHPRIGP